MGMEAFAQRATNELAVTARNASGISRNPDGLTAHERNIAELARDGLSNPQIGARLFLSPRTVEWHLRHVYSSSASKPVANCGVLPSGSTRGSSGRGGDG